MELDLRVQITRPDGNLSFASTETDAAFILLAHLPGFIKDKIEVELNDAGTEISIIGKGERGEGSFVEAGISGRVRISCEELLEGFRKVFPIPNNVVLDRIEVGFEEEEDILVVLLPKSTRGEGPSGVEIEEMYEENFRGDEEEERISMTVEVEETSPDYNEEGAQEQQNLDEVERKKSTDELEGEPDGETEPDSREATTKIVIEDKGDMVSELIIDEPYSMITPSITEEPPASKAEEEEEEEAPKQKYVDELELKISLEVLEGEPGGETTPDSKKIAIGAQTDDKEEEEQETELIIEEPDFTITHPSLEEPIVSEAYEVAEEEEEQEEADDDDDDDDDATLEKTLEEKEQKQKNQDELEPKKSSGKSEGEPDGEIELERKKQTIKIEINDEEEEESGLITTKPDFITTPPSQEEPTVSIASDSKKEKEEKEEEEMTTKEKVREQEDLGELGRKKSLEEREGELDGETESKYKEMTIEESDFTITPPPSEESTVSKPFETKEVGEKKVQEQKTLNEQEPKKSSEALEGEPDRDTKLVHKEMAIEEPDFTITPPPSEKPTASKPSKSKETKEKKAQEQKTLDEVKPKKSSEELEGELYGETKPEYKKMTIEEPDFTITPSPPEEPTTLKASEPKEEEMEKRVQEQKTLDELESKRRSEAPNGEPDGETESEHKKMAIEELDFTRAPHPSEEPTASKTYEPKKKEKEKEVQERKTLDKLELKKSSEALEDEPDGETKPEYKEKTIEEPDFTITPPPREEPTASKAFKPKEVEMEKEIQEQKILDDLEPRRRSKAQEGKLDREIEPEHKKLAIGEPNFIKTPRLPEEPIASEASEPKEKEKEKEVQEQKTLDEIELNKSLETLEDKPDRKTQPKYREMAVEEPDFTIIPPSEKPTTSKAFESEEEGEKKEVQEQQTLNELELCPSEKPTVPKAYEPKEKKRKKEVQERKTLNELELKKSSEALEGEPDGETKSGCKEMTIEEPKFTITPSPPEEPIVSKTFKLKEVEKEKEIQEQKTLDKIKPKRRSEAQEGKPDGEIELEYKKMAIEELDFTRTPRLSEEPTVLEASEPKEKEMKKEVQEQKTLNEIEPNKSLEALEGKSDRETQPEYKEMAVEESDFIITPPSKEPTISKTFESEKKGEKKEVQEQETLDEFEPCPSDEPIAPKAYEPIEKKKEKEVQEQKTLDELEPKKSLEVLEGEPDGETKSGCKEMTIEEPEFTITPPPPEEPTASKAFKPKEVEVKKEIQKQKTVDKLEPKRKSKAQEGKPDGEIEPEHKKMTIEEPNFTRTPRLSEESIASEASELKEKEKEKEIEEQKTLDEIEPNKSLEALEGKPDREIQPKYKEMAVEEPDFTITPPSEEPTISKTFEYEEEGEKKEVQEQKTVDELEPCPSEEPIASKVYERIEKKREKEVKEQKTLDKLEPKKDSKALEGEPDEETKSGCKEMTIEKPEFAIIPPPPEEPTASKAFKPKEVEVEKEIQEQKTVDELEPKRKSKTQKGKPDGEIELEHKKMAIEEPDFTRTPRLSEESIASEASERKEKEKEKEVQEQKTLDEIEPNKSLEALEGKPDRETQPEHKEMAAEEPDFTIKPPLEEPTISKIFESEEDGEKKEVQEQKTVDELEPCPSEEPIASKAYEPIEKKMEKEVKEHKTLDELEPKKSSEALEGEPDGETKPGCKEMTIEELEFTITPPPPEEPTASKAFKPKEIEVKKEIQEQKTVDELEPKRKSEAQEGKPDGEIELEHKKMAIEEPDFTRTPRLSEESIASEASERKEKEKEKEVQEQKTLDEIEPNKSLEALEDKPDRETQPEHKEMAAKEPDFTIKPPLEEPTISKIFESEEDGEKKEVQEQKTVNELEPCPSEEPIASKAYEPIEKKMEKEVKEHKTLDELEPKKSSEALEGEPDGETKPGCKEMTIEELEFTITPPPPEEPTASKAFKPKEIEVKKEIQEQKTVDELEPKRKSKAQEGKPDGEIELEHKEMAIEEPDFTRTPRLSEESIASEASERKEKKKEKEVQEQKTLDEIEPNKSLEALESKPDRETQPEHKEMAVQEPDFTVTPPSEELTTSKTFESEEEREKKEVQEQKTLDELEPQKSLEAVEGKPDGKTELKYKEMAIKAQTDDKKEKKNGLIKEEPDFTTTLPPSKEPITSKACESKEKEGEGEMAEEEKVQDQKNLDELELKKDSEASEGKPDVETEPEHKEMAIEASAEHKEEEETILIKDEPTFTTTPPPKEPVTSKASKLKEEREMATEEKAQEQKNLDELESKKSPKALEVELHGETEPEHREMALERQTHDKKEKKTELIIKEPDLTTSKSKEGGEKATEEKAQELKNLDELELKKGLKVSEVEPDGVIELKPKEKAIEAPTEHKEEEETGLATKKPDFTIASPALEEPIPSDTSEEKEKAQEDLKEPKNLEEQIQSKASKEEEEEKEEEKKAIEEKTQEQKYPDELEAKKSLEELKGEPNGETEPEPKETTIEAQTEYKIEEKTERITEESDFTTPPPPLEDQVTSKASKSKEEEEEQRETPTNSYEEQDREEEVPRRALETFESTGVPKQDEDRPGFGEEAAKEPEIVKEIAHVPAPKTLMGMETPEDVDSDHQEDEECEARETDTRAPREDDREIVSEVDGGEDASREEEEESESSNRDRDCEESSRKRETKEDEEANGNGMNGTREKRKRRRGRRRSSSIHLTPSCAIAGSVFMLSLGALVIHLMKNRWRSHAMR